MSCLGVVRSRAVGHALLWLALATLPLGGQSLTYERVTVAEGIHLFLGPDPGAGNAVAIVSDGEALVVDATASPRSADAIIDDLVRLGVRRLRGIVNSHWHQGHIWGNQAFLERFPAAPVIAHRKTRDDIRDFAVPDLAVQIGRIRARLAERDSLLRIGLNASGEVMTETERGAVEQRQILFRDLVEGLEAVEPELPQITFEQTVTVQVGVLTVTLTHLGPAHSFGDVVAHVPERGVLIAGDLVTKPYPAAAEGFSSIVGWLSALDTLQSMDFDLLIPGHGDLVRDPREYLADLQGLMTSVVDQTRDGIERGSDAETIASDLDISAFADAHVPDDERQRAAFQAFFVQPAVAIAYRELNR